MFCFFFVGGEGNRMEWRGRCVQKNLIKINHRRKVKSLFFTNSFIAYFLNNTGCCLGFLLLKEKKRTKKKVLGNFSVDGHKNSIYPLFRLQIIFSFFSSFFFSSCSDSSAKLSIHWLLINYKTLFNIFFWNSCFVFLLFLFA